jgi:hypothetical protein
VFEDIYVLTRTGYSTALTKTWTEEESASTGHSFLRVSEYFEIVGEDLTRSNKANVASRAAEGFKLYNILRIRP